MDRQRSVAAVLALGSGLVIAAGVAAVVVRDPATGVSDDTLRPVAADTPTPLPSITRPAVRPMARHPAVLGEHHARQHPQQAEELPFTGPLPISPAVAVGLLMLVGGSWSIAAAGPRVSAVGATVVVITHDDVVRGLSLLARVPTGLRSPRSEDAIGRLRSPGHQL